MSIWDKQRWYKLLTDFECVCRMFEEVCPQGYCTDEDESGMIELTGDTLKIENNTLTIKMLDSIGSLLFGTCLSDLRMEMRILWKDIETKIAEGDIGIPGRLPTDDKDTRSKIWIRADAFIDCLETELPHYFPQVNSDESFVIARTNLASFIAGIDVK